MEKKKNTGKLVLSVLLLAAAVILLSPMLRGFLPENIGAGINTFIEDHFTKTPLRGSLSLRSVLLC